jgi:hypothetical protein
MYIYFLVGLVLSFIPFNGIFGTNLFQIFLLVYFINGIALFSYRNKFKLKLNKKLTLIFCLVLIVNLISILRTNITGSSVLINVSKCIYLIVFTIFVVAFLNKYSRKRNLEVYFWNIGVNPMIVYGVLNLLMVLFDVQFKELYKVNLGKSVFLSYLNLDVERVNFPLTQGINTFASVFSFIFTTSLLFIFFLKTRGFKIYFALVTSLIILFLCDSRVLIIAPVFITVLFVVLKNNKFFSYAPFLIPLGPILLWALLIFYKDNSLLNLISRSSSELETGNSRFIIWSYCLNEFSFFKFIHLFGYGQYGHFGSGVSRLWVDIFSNSFKSPELNTPHNSFLSLLFDIGYFGVIIYVLFFYTIIKVIISKINYNKFYYSFLGYFLLLIFTGITESNLGIYNLLNFYQLIVLSLCFIVLYSNNADGRTNNFN